MEYTLPPMYCPNCGSQLESGSRFCRTCGAQNLITLADLTAASVPASANITDQSTTLGMNEEKEVFRTVPAFYSLGFSYALALLLTLLTTILVAYFQGPLKLVLVLALFYFFFPLRRHLARNSTSYTLTTSKIEIEYGLFGKTQRNIPIHNIQDVTVQASLGQRLLGVGNVIIDSASAAGKIQMENVHQPRQHADMILAQLPRRQS
jgi:membrane protein YdbS with pleckstrin-like domain